MRNLIYILLFTQLSYSQDNYKDFITGKINPVVENLQYILDGNEYIIYATPYRMLLIAEREDDFIELIFTDKGDGFRLSDIDVIDDAILNEMFNTKNYIEGFVDTNSEFYKKNPIEELSGLPVYFSLKTTGDNQNYCEYILSVFTRPVPMKQDLYGYISLKFLGIKQ